MTSETYPNPEGEPIPRLRLQEGIDFLDHTELHARIMQELDAQGRATETALLCGHNQDDNGGQPRMRTYALTASETAIALKYAPRTPYDEAISTADSSGTPTITVYDGQLMQECAERAGQYETRDGRPIDSAAILQVELSVW